LIDRGVAKQIGKAAENGHLDSPRKVDELRVAYTARNPFSN
jgi:hypothetical protein